MAAEPPQPVHPSKRNLQAKAKTRVALRIGVSSTARNNASNTAAGMAWGDS
ncbi:MAG: hypothetical protein U5M72_06075 [Pseudomonas sp.]|nr:hypothetical protein [Pseudomonas sp.]